MAVDWGLAFQNTPVTATERSLTHLGSILDAVMQRRQNEELARAKMAQEASQFAINQKREQQLADQAVRHQQAEEAQARAALDQKDRQEVRSGIQGVLPAVKTAVQGGDIPGANLAGSQWGVKVAPVMAPAPTDDQALGPKVPDATAASQTSANPLDVMQATMARVRAEQLQREAAGPQPTGQYNITAGDQTIAYDPEAEKRHQKEEAHKTSAAIAGVAGPGNVFDQQAKQQVQRELEAGILRPEEAGKAYADYTKYYQTEADKERDARIRAAAMMKPFDEKSFQFTDLSGQKIFRATTVQGAEKMQEARAAGRTILSNVDRMKVFNSQNGTKLIPGWDAAKLKERDTIAGAITAQLTKMWMTGTLQDAEYKRYSDMLKASWALSADQANQILDEIGAGVKQSFNDQALSRSNMADSGEPSTALAPAASIATPPRAASKRASKKPPSQAALDLARELSGGQ